VGMGRTSRLRLLLNRCAVTSHSVSFALRRILDNAARQQSDDINQTPACASISQLDIKK
jgi:hypothetical protein